MEGSSQEISKHPELVNSDLLVRIESVCKSRNIVVNGLETPRKENFVEEPLPSSSLYHQPHGDAVDLLSAIPIPLSVIPPGPTPYGHNLSISGMDCEKVYSTVQALVADNNLGGSTHYINTSLKKSSIYPVHGNNQMDKLSWEDYHVSLNGYRNSYTGIESASLSETGGKQILAQYSGPVEQRVYEESYNIMQSDAAVTIAIRGPREASSSNAVDSRRRRAKIAEGIKALEESTPQFGKGTRESVLDNVIDYVKYLKLQVTALSQNRLGGEPIYHPFVHLEGFGHYMLHQQMPSEPLEDVVGHLMESNMPLAIQLLESKGLQLLPISYADIIVKASADKLV